MKALYIALMCCGLCKAQTPVLSINTHDYGYTNGAYYKDINNDLNKFIGTWKYTNGTTTLTITLQKKVMLQNTLDSLNFYEDILVGEYKYVENGVEKINTLSQLSQSWGAYKYNITGNILKNNNNRVDTSFWDPNRDIEGMEPRMVFERADAGTIQKLKVKFYTVSGRYSEEGIIPPYTSYTIPFGEYLLVKQP